jgi:hypothetical protein
MERRRSNERVAIRVGTKTTKTERKTSKKRGTGPRVARRWTKKSPRSAVGR